MLTHCLEEVWGLVRSFDPRTSSRGRRSMGSHLLLPLLLIFSEEVISTPEDLRHNQERNTKKNREKPD